MTDSPQPGILVQQLRQGRGWSRSELAKRSGVSTTTITNYERGTRSDKESFNPNISKVMQVAAPFGSADATKILRAYGFTKEADRVEQGEAPPQIVTGSTGNGNIAPGTMFEAVGPISGKRGDYVFKDPTGELRIFNVST